MPATQRANNDRSSRPGTLFALEAQRLLVVGDARRAVEVCKRGLTHHPENPTGYVVLAQAYIQLDEKERALNVLRDGYRRTSSDRLNKLALELSGELSPVAEDAVAGDAPHPSTPPLVATEADEPQVAEAVTEPIVEPAAGSEATSGSEAAFEAEPEPTPASDVSLTTATTPEPETAPATEPTSASESMPLPEPIHALEPVPISNSSIDTDEAETLSIPASQALSPVTEESPVAEEFPVAEESPVMERSQEVEEPEMIAEIAVEPVDATEAVEPVASEFVEPVADAQAATAEAVDSPASTIAQETPVEIADAQPEEIIGSSEVEPGEMGKAGSTIDPTESSDLTESSQNAPAPAQESPAAEPPQEQQRSREPRRSPARNATVMPLGGAGRAPVQQGTDAGRQMPIRTIEGRSAPDMETTQERPRPLALHLGKNISRLRSSNLRLIPGLEFAPLRHEDNLRRQSIAPLINEPMPMPMAEPSLRSQKGVEEKMMPSLPGLDNEMSRQQQLQFGEREERKTSTIIIAPAEEVAEDVAEPLPHIIEEEPEPEAEDAILPFNGNILQMVQAGRIEAELTPLEELARRLETARIPVVEEPEQRPVFQPSLVSETLANILVAQGAYAEALKAFQTLARQKPEQFDYFQQRIREMKWRLQNPSRPWPPREESPEQAGE